MKKCPYCAEEIQDKAIFCRWCSRDLVQKESTKDTTNLQLHNTENSRPKNQRNVFWWALLFGLGAGGIVYGYRINTNGNLNDAFFGGLSSVFIYGGLYSFIVWIKRAFIKRDKSISRFSNETGCISIVIFALGLLAFFIFLLF